MRSSRVIVPALIWPVGLILSLAWTSVTASSQEVIWQHRSDSGPSPRRSMRLAYDSARGVTVLFGGIAGSDYQDDTWEWDGTSWTQRCLPLEDCGPAVPSPREAYGMAYDSARGVTVLFGGYDGTWLGDTWEWDGFVWMKVDDGDPNGITSPAPRAVMGMVYDSADGVVLMYGGAAGSAASSQFEDLWQWNGTAWTMLRQSPGESPGARSFFGMTYDAVRGVTVLFGGTFGAGFQSLRDTWELSGATWTWTEPCSICPPPNGIWLEMAYDSARGVSVRFGSWIGPPAVDETWEWDGMNWTEQAIPGPPGRSDHGMAYDSKRKVVVLFGGTDAGIPHLGDTWELGPDCNANQILDAVDIADGTSTDNNDNGTPDECDPCASPFDVEYAVSVTSEPGMNDVVADLPASVTTAFYGDAVYAELYARDIGCNNTGLVTVAADLDYPEECVSAVRLSAGEDYCSDTFPQFCGGTDTGAIIEELTGSQLTCGVGVEPEWVRVAIVEFVIDGDCDAAAFSLLPADSESSKCFQGLVPTSEIAYGTASVDEVLPGSQCVYDLDGNCLTAGGDLGVFAGCWLCSDGQPCWDPDVCPRADFDCNGTVAGGDLGWFAVAWQRQCEDLDAATELPPCKRCGGLVRCPWPEQEDCVPLQPGPAPQMPEERAATQPQVELQARLIAAPTRSDKAERLRSGQVGAIEVGQRFFAEVWARDLAADSQGLTGVFVDLHFNPADVAVSRVIPTETYGLFADANVLAEAGIIRRLGGATLESGHGAGEWVRVATVELEALHHLKSADVTITPAAQEAVSAVGRGHIPDEQLLVHSNAR